MVVTTLAVIILLAMLVIHLIETLAELLDMRRLMAQSPASAADVYEEEDYARMKEHTTAEMRLGMLESTVSLAVLLVFWLAGGFGWLAGASSRLLGEGLAGGMVFTGVLYLGGHLVRLPFSAYHTFVIEQRFGFNTTTPKLFVADQIKSLLVSALLGGMLLALVSLVFIHGGPLGWLAAWAVVVAFTAAMMVVGPLWILPLFNTFEKLPEGPLRDAVLQMAARCGFPLGDIFVMDGSRRSSRANAFFAGFGRGKRIVLYDTLLKRHTQDELLAILAHEIGHWRLRHLAQRMGLTASAAAVGLWLASVAVHHPLLYASFGVEPSNLPRVTVGLTLFGIAASPLLWLAGIVTASISRRHEFEADAFAAKTQGGTDSLAAALVNLSRDNLVNLDPHPLVVALHYSHPPLRQRLAALRALSGHGAART